MPASSLQVCLKRQFFYINIILHYIPYVCAEMTKDAGRLVTSDGRSIAESGLGSEVDLYNGTDTTPTLSDATSLMSASSDVFCSDLLPADVPDLEHLRDRFDEVYADSKPEVNTTPEVDTGSVEKRPTRPLPAVPSNETSLDDHRDPVPRFHDRQFTGTEAAAKKAEDRKQNCAELWSIGASVSKQDFLAKWAYHSLPTSAGIKRKVLGQLPTQDDSVLTANSEPVAVTTLPRSRDLREPIGDVSRPLTFYLPTSLVVQDDHVGQNMDRKSVENGTLDRKWRRRVNPMSYYLNGDTQHPHDVFGPEVTSDRKYAIYVTSPERDRKPRLSCSLSELGTADDLTVVSGLMTVNSPHGHQHSQQGRPQPSCNDDDDCDRLRTSRQTNGIIIIIIINFFNNKPSVV